MMRKVLLLEPNYRNKYPPMGLMKIATYYRNRGDDVRFYKGDLKEFAAYLLCEEFLERVGRKSFRKYEKKLTEYIRVGKLSIIFSIPELSTEILDIIKMYRLRYKNEQFPKFDVVCITTLFTFYWNKTIHTIRFAKKLCKTLENIKIGGIASSILPNLIFEATGIYPHIGLLDKPGALDEGDTTIIDNLPLDYSILDEVEYKYPVTNAYFAYMTRGCPNKCSFCAVPRLEPEYKDYINLKAQIKKTEEQFGAKKDLLLLDNNVLASECFEKIVDEIKECGFEKGATFSPPNEYTRALENLRKGYNEQACIKKIVAYYDSISVKLPEAEQADFYLTLEQNECLYHYTATKDAILEMHEYVEPLYAKTHKKLKQTRFVDFNQGVDARLITDTNMKKLSEINIQPLRIAFDNWVLHEVYENAIRLATKNGIRHFSNYMLYNCKDKPEDLYDRLALNIKLCDEDELRGITIYSFPMKYHPIDDPLYFNNRDYIGIHWNRKFIRAIQSVLNATKGKIGKGKSFFEEAFGKNKVEFFKILWMPEAFIINRFKYKDNLTAEWWEKFSSLNEKQQQEAEAIISLGKFHTGDFNTSDKAILEILDYYKIRKG